jgi:hypothetical protein
LQLHATAVPLPSTPPQPSHTACANQPQSHPPTMMSVTADGAGALAVPASCKRKAEADRPGSPAHDAKIAAKGSRKRGCPRVQPTPRCGKCAPCIAGPRPTGSYKNKCKAPPAGPPLGDHGGGAVATAGWCELSLADLPCAWRPMTRCPRLRPPRCVAGPPTPCMHACAFVMRTRRHAPLAPAMCMCTCSVHSSGPGNVSRRHAGHGRRGTLSTLNLHVPRAAAALPFTCTAGVRA